jgi:hypothetical protein
MVALLFLVIRTWTYLEWSREGRMCEVCSGVGALSTTLGSGEQGLPGRRRRASKVPDGSSLTSVCVVSLPLSQRNSHAPGPGLGSFTVCCVSTRKSWNWLNLCIR